MTGGAKKEHTVSIDYIAQVRDVDVPIYEAIFGSGDPHTAKLVITKKGEVGLRFKPFGLTSLVHPAIGAGKVAVSWSIPAMISAKSLALFLECNRESLDQAYAERSPNPLDVNHLNSEAESKYSPLVNGCRGKQDLDAIMYFDEFGNVHRENGPAIIGQSECAWCWHGKQGGPNGLQAVFATGHRQGLIIYDNCAAVRVLSY